MLQKTPPHAAVTSARRTIFVRDLVVSARIGAYDHEYAAAQPVRIDIEVETAPPADPFSESLEDVMCYNRLAAGVRAIIAEGHIRLVETLAERICALALSNPLALSARVRVAKPEALDDAAAAGVEIFRTKA